MSEPADEHPTNTAAGGAQPTRRTPIEAVVGGVLALAVAVGYVLAGSREPAPETTIARAVRLAAAGRDAEAERAFQQALHESPAAPEAHLGLGDALWRRGAYTEAERAYRAALAIHEDPRTRYGLGMLARLSGRAPDAIREFDRTLELDPRHWLALLQRGILLAEAQDLAGARLAFEAVLAIDPENLDGLHNLGYTLSELGEPARGIPMLEAVVRVDWRRTATWFELGRAQEGAARLDLAESAYERVLALDPRHEMARARLSAVRGAGQVAPERPSGPDPGAGDRRHTGVRQGG